MLGLADTRDDLLARAAVDGARRLREVVRALSPVAAEVSAADHALARDLEVVIRRDRPAA
jgi:hypothetical protein